MAASDQGQNRIYREIGGSSGATGMVFTSGSRALFEPGSLLQSSGQMTLGPGSTFTLNSSMTLGAGARINASAGAVQMPGSLSRGYLPLNVLGGVEAGASAPSALTTGTNPERRSVGVNTLTRVRWTTAAGASDELILPAVRVPFDLATAGGLEVIVVAEGASANASNELNVRVRAGTATADIGTTRALTSSPVESTIAVTAANTPATGFLSVGISPNAHASGFIDLYSAGISYLKKTS